MTITPASLAAVNAVSVENQQFAVSAGVIPQKNVIVGAYDSAVYTTIVPEVPQRIFSAEEAGSLYGFGTMLHRLARAAFRAGTVETWVVPQEEVAGDAAQGSIAHAGGPATAAGEIAYYINGERVPVTVAVGDTITDVGDNLVDAIAAREELPVVGVNAGGTVTLTSKSTGPWGDDITLDINIGTGEEIPAGLGAITITAMGVVTAGTGTPDIQDALDALGTGDAQNEKGFTNLIHGYGIHAATLNAISTYNGIGNQLVGNYSKLVARPFRSLVGDTVAGAAGLAAVLASADSRRELDRTSGVISVPGSLSHPQEIAAEAVGVMAVTASIRAEETYIDKVLAGVHPGDMADRWTNDYDNRDQAVRGGVSTTLVKNGIVFCQNLITFYRPAAVAPESNGYRAMRNISIIQNLLYNYRMNFERDKWKGVTIVADAAAVSNVTSRAKARDVSSVLDDLVALAEAFAANAWIYTDEYTKTELKKGDKVTLRAGLTGFDMEFPVILSGEGGIYNSLITFDTSIAILLTGGV